MNKSMSDAEYDSEDNTIGDDRISRQMRDFINPDEEGEVRGNATYQPEGEDEHPMRDRELESIRKQGTQSVAFLKISTDVSQISRQT